jgi:orotate phosphoribosyltransferase
MNDKEHLLKLLIERSFRKMSVRLTSGKTSDFFIDCKQAVLTATGHALVGRVMFAALKELRPCTAVAGVELGGCPLVSAVSLTSYLHGTPLDAMYVRKNAKSHGSQRVIEGNDLIAPGSSIAVLEDTLTTGASSMNAVMKLRDAGYDVVGIVALVDRLEGASEEFSKASVRFASVFTRNDFPV